MENYETTKRLVLFLALLVSGFTSHAITNSAIAVSGTNIVLSWPSFGYESYLVQYRQTLDPTDSWSVLTNAYHANSTNRTTLTLRGAVTAPGGSGGQFMMMSSSMNASSLMASGPLLYLLMVRAEACLWRFYPPGFDFSNFKIFGPGNGRFGKRGRYVE